MAFVHIVHNKHGVVCGLSFIPEGQDDRKFVELYLQAWQKGEAWLGYASSTRYCFMYKNSSPHDIPLPHRYQHALHRLYERARKELCLVGCVDSGGRSGFKIVTEASITERSVLSIQRA
jgi:hypothetical protein